MLNASALNGAALNASAGCRVQYGAVQAEARAEALASAFIFAHPHTSIEAPAQCTSASFQVHAAAAEAVLAVAVLATIPKIRHASASAPGSEAHAIAVADITRYVVAVTEASASLAPNAVRTVFALGHSSAQAELVIDDTVIAKPTAHVVATAEATVEPRVTRHVAAAIPARANISALAGYAYSAAAAIVVRCTGFAAAGYGVPSLSVFGARADMYAYARQRHEVSAEPMRPKALVTCVALASCMGEAVPLCRAVVTASATAAQGVAQGLGGNATVTARAEYWFLARAAATAAAGSIASGDSALSGAALAAASARVRVETQVNNELEGFADPAAVSNISMVAQGIVVAPFAVHFWGTAEVQPDATYVHRSKAVAPVAATVSPVAIRVLMGEAFVPASASATASGHWEWSGRADSGASAQASGFALQRHKAFAGASARSAVTAAAIWGHGARAVISAAAATDSFAERHRMGMATSFTTADMLPLNPAQNHAAKGYCPAHASAEALAHWHWEGSSSIACAASLLAHSGQEHVSTAAIWAECAAQAEAGQGHSAGLHIVATANDTDATCTHIHGALVAVGALADMLPVGSYGHMGFADMLCPATCTAESIGNPDARDPLARTMNRPSVERTMTRPFVDRTMKTTSA